MPEVLLLESAAKVKGDKKKKDNKKNAGTMEIPTVFHNLDLL
jgi:hypothetical protein